MKKILFLIATALLALMVTSCKDAAQQDSNQVKSAGTINQPQDVTPSPTDPNANLNTTTPTVDPVSPSGPSISNPSVTNPSTNTPTVTPSNPATNTPTVNPVTPAPGPSIPDINPSAPSPLDATNWQISTYYRDGDNYRSLLTQIMQGTTPDYQDLLLWTAGKEDAGRALFQSMVKTVVINTGNSGQAYLWSSSTGTLTIRTPQVRGFGNVLSGVITQIGNFNQAYINSQL